MAQTVYNVIINTGDSTQGKNGYIAYHKVSSLRKFKRFADSKYPTWCFGTVYNHATKEKLYLIKPDNLFPTFQKELSIGGFGGDV